jgi:glycosyltransferase involved in cell wall biosynthesis
LNCLISIVTINLNNLSGLIKTVESVLLQDYPNVEYLIIDGGSTDGSVDFISSNKDKFDYWISEKDEGIYDAMNKGIVHARGEYLIFLNSGDFFSCRAALSKLIYDNLTYDIIYGNLALNKISTQELIKYPSLLSLKYFRYATLPHQATLIRKKLFLNFGNYSTNYKIVSDWVFFCDVIIKRKARYKYVDELISIFDTNGISSQPSGGQVIRREVAHYFKKEFWFSFYYFKLLWAIKYYPKRIFKELGFK